MRAACRYSIDDGIDDRIDVLRVLHSARDVEAEFGEYKSAGVKSRRKCLGIRASRLDER